MKVDGVIMVIYHCCLMECLGVDGGERIWCDETIAFPLLVTALIQKLKRNHPEKGNQ